MEWRIPLADVDFGEEELEAVEACAEEQMADDGGGDPAVRAVTSANSRGSNTVWQCRTARRGCTWRWWRWGSERGMR